MADSLVFTPSFLQELAHQDVARALLEDVGAGDLTAALVDPSRRAPARVRVACDDRGMPRPTGWQPGTLAPLPAAGDRHRRLTATP